MKTQEIINAEQRNYFTFEEMATILGYTEKSFNTLWNRKKERFPAISKIGNKRVIFKEVYEYWLEIQVEVSLKKQKDNTRTT